MTDIQGQTSLQHDHHCRHYVRQIPESIKKTVETMDELMRRATEKDKE